MPRHPKDILAPFSKAVISLLADDDIAKANPDEVSITTELARLMAPHFPDWRVNPEWSRRQDEEKKIAWNDDKEIERLKKIRPDIIVHHMLREENLLVVEAKRAGRKRHHANDILKLTCMTVKESVNPDYHYGYEVGVHLIIDIPSRLVASCEVYVDGKMNAGFTAWLQEQLPNRINA